MRCTATLLSTSENYLFNGRTATSTVRDSLKQNQFGASSVGDHQEQTFLLFWARSRRSNAPNPAGNIGYSMTPAMLNGDFSVIASTQCQPKQITLAAPFINNVLPLSDMNPSR